MKIYCVNNVKNFNNFKWTQKEPMQNKNSKETLGKHVIKQCHTLHASTFSKLHLYMTALKKEKHSQETPAYVKLVLPSQWEGLVL